MQVLFHPKTRTLSAGTDSPPCFAGRRRKFQTKPQPMPALLQTRPADRRCFLFCASAAQTEKHIPMHSGVECHEDQSPMRGEQMQPAGENHTAGNGQPVKHKSAHHNTADGKSQYIRQQRRLITAPAKRSGV